MKTSTISTVLNGISVRWEKKGTWVRTLDPVPEGPGREMVQMLSTGHPRSPGAVERAMRGLMPTASTKVFWARLEALAALQAAPDDPEAAAAWQAVADEVEAAYAAGSAIHAAAQEVN